MLAKFAYRNVLRNRRRSVIAVLTIGMGVFGLLFLEGFFSGLLELHKENSVRSRYGHGQVMTKGYWEQSFEEPSKHWIEDSKALAADLEKHPAIRETYTRVQFFALLTNGSVNVAGKGQGIDGAKEKNFFDKMNFIAGGPIGDRADGIILGKGLAQSLNAKVGDRVTVMGQTTYGTVDAFDSFVTGIFHVGMKEADDTLFQVQIKEAQRMLDTDRVESIALQLHDEDQWPAVASYVQERFPDMEILSVYQLDKAWAENGKNFLTALMNIFKLTFVGMILLAIYNSASSTIMERRREMGMLRANGESTKHLGILLVLESSFLTVGGVLVAVLFMAACFALVGDGVPMPPTPGTTRVLPVPLQIEFLDVFSALALGSIATLGATLLSFTQIARIPILESIKSPT